MKKILFFISIFFLSITNCFAANKIESIDISIYLDQLGNASIKEVWTVDGSDGTEWYKVMNNLGNSKISNFKVSMDGTELIYKNWNINESLSQKKGYYGIINKSNGVELCFGKYDYKKHVFTLTYDVSNYVFNTEDAQVLYWTLISSLSDVDFKNFSLELSSYYSFPDTLDVWGYGYKGYAYVENGKIKMSNEGKMGDNYVVLLAKFPLNTFQTTNSYSQFKTFDSVLNKAEQGTFEYNYDNTIIYDLVEFLFPFVYAWFCIAIAIAATKPKYGFKDNKKIDKNNTPMFRDIPCNKDIYYANALVEMNGFSKTKSNILGAILLKWIKIGKVVVKKTEKEQVDLILNIDVPLTNPLEDKLFVMIYSASKDGVLEGRELENWARSNYSKYLNLFNKIKNDKITELKEQGHIYKRTNRKECKHSQVMDDLLYEESKKLYGLKLFLEEFSRIETKEAIEVHLWDQYLMFAYLFGMADKVAKQFKNLYPEVLENSEYSGVDFDTIIFINRISTGSVSAANSARSAAQSYSSGGGGFSSGGGGGGSFGGGGGGSR